MRLTPCPAGTAQIKRDAFRVFNRAAYHDQYKNYLSIMPDFSRIHNPKNAGTCSEENETSCNCLAFQGTMLVHSRPANGAEATQQVSGNGHHGIDYVGVASIRAGKGIMMGSLATAAHMVKIM